MKFLDPACGSGNFLTETYISLRRLENDILKNIHEIQQLLGNNFLPIEVKISQFYGIEINDFAVTVAKTALWIAESQMMKETEKIVEQNLNFLPLSTSATIVEGNALRMDWSTLSAEKSETFVYADKLNVYAVGEPKPKYGEHYKELNVVAKEVESKELSENIKNYRNYNYIIGNPPFVGYTFQSESQKEDLEIVSNDTGKNIDYVAGWYFKAAQLMQNTQTKCAFVSTNSITQGEQVAVVWKPLFEKYNVNIDFAWRTFKWANETSDKKNMAAVHCVIIGFSCHKIDDLSTDNAREQRSLRHIFNADGTIIQAGNISPYLIDAPNVFIEKRRGPLCKVSKIYQGSRPIDGGNLILSAEEYNDFIKKEPEADKFVRVFLGAEEFINGKKRYCLWLINANPAELRKMPLIMKRIEAVKKLRSDSGRSATRNMAAYPYLFAENRQPETGNYLLIPSTSSERRYYIPIGFLSSDVIASNANLVIPNATLYEFGILTSSIHNAWMRVIAGRLKSDYRYSNEIVYNNFPWCHPTKAQKTKIEQTAQAVLDVRTKYPDSSFADLYDETLMPPDLRKAHKENDNAVMQAYGFNPKMKEAAIVAELFRMYKKLTEKK